MSESTFAASARAATHDTSIPLGAQARSAAARAAVFAVTAALAWCYADVFRTMWRQWSVSDVYSYCYLIPVISGWIAWNRRSRLAAAAFAPKPRLGIVVLLSGMALLWVGRAAGIVAFQEVSLLPTLFGVILILAGSSAAAALALPIGYLLFMLPVWDFFTDRLHGPFQLLSASLGAKLLALTSVPVHRTGVLLELPNVTLEVARACSGVNYLVSVLAISLPVAGLTFRSPARRGVIIAGSVIVAILSNSLRVALIGVLAYNGVSGDIHGPWHVFQGLFVAVVGYLAMFAGVALLSRYEPPTADDNLRAGAIETPFMVPARKWAAAALVPTIVLLAMPMLSRSADAESGAERSAASVTLPRLVGRWEVGGRPSADWRLPLAAAPNREAWTVFRSGSQEITTYVGAYAAGRRRDGSDGYWTDAFGNAARPIDVVLPGGERVRGNLASVPNGDGGRLQLVYMFSLNGWTTNDRPLAKLYQSLHRVSGFGAPAVVAVAVVDVRMETQITTDLLVSFLGGLWPAVQPISGNTAKAD
jgi:exosortase